MVGKIKYVFISFGVALLLFGCSKERPSYTEIPKIAPTMTINFDNKINQIKKVNGINNGPKSHSIINNGEVEWSLDMTEAYKELEIPYVRTHDSEYPDGSDYFIDIHCVFPNMSRDPDDESAYSFAGTDEYVSNIRESGAEVFYRLGESIAPTEAEVTYQNPPEDYEKWASICDHIIAHYNEGWNNGFNYNIQYWEIWNEPDTPRQWTGDMDEYYELYRITARYLKDNHPDIKVGGGAFASAEKDVLIAFLEGINNDGRSTPLDFISWHLYTDEPYRFTYRANLARTLLDEYGYDNAETFCDEWNYVDAGESLETTWNRIQSSDIAAFNAACLITLQNCNVDGAMYYDGSFTGGIASWCGLYDADGKILPGYYAFWAFNQIKEMSNQVEITSLRNPYEYGIYACAVSGETEMILISNISDNIVRFKLKSNSKKTNVSTFVVNGDYPLGVESSEQTNFDETMIEMRPWEMRLIKLN